MNNSYHHIAIALAGVCQSAQLVTQLANTGVCDSQIYTRSIQSILNTSPKTTDDVYGGIQHVKLGLQILIKVLSTGQKDQLENIRYLFSTLALSNKLLKNSDALGQVEQRLARIKTLYPHTDEGTLSDHLTEISYSLAGIYSDVISPLAAKIKVTGKIEFLQNLLVQAKVRTSLLSCIRSAMLWYQVGGKRMQFIWSRNKIRSAAHALLQEIDQLS